MPLVITETWKFRKEANPFLSDEVARHLTLHGTNWNEDRSLVWKFDNYTRPVNPFLKDESVLVRTAAARAIAAAGDAGATTVLVRRLEQEKDEGVLAALLKAVGQLGAKEALEVLARFAEPGGKTRRTPFVRAAAIEGLARLDRVEAKALLELYARDKEPTVKRAAEASLR